MLTVTSEDVYIHTLLQLPKEGFSVTRSIRNVKFDIIKVSYTMGLLFIPDVCNRSL